MEISIHIIQSWNVFMATQIFALKCMRFEGRETNLNKNPAQYKTELIDSCYTWTLWRLKIGSKICV